MTVFLLFVSAGAFLLMLFFAYEDFFDGLSLLVLYLALPAAVLVPIHLLVPVWSWALNLVFPWLLEVPGSP